MLTRMPYTWQNNEDHKYFRSVCLSGRSWEDASCSLFLTLQSSGLCSLGLIWTKTFLSKADIRANSRFPLAFAIGKVQVASPKSWGKKFKAHKQWLNPFLYWLPSVCLSLLGIKFIGSSQDVDFLFPLRGN